MENETNIDIKKIKQRVKEQRKMERIKADPIRYAKYLQRRREAYLIRKQRMVGVGDSELRERKNQYAKEYYNNKVVTDVEKVKIRREKSREAYHKTKNLPGYIERMKEYRSKNAVKLNESYRNRTRRRVFKRLSKYSNKHYKLNRITAFDLWKIAKNQKCKCVFTGVQLTVDNMSVDHIIPRSKGGLNIPSNIRLVIKPVNIARQTMSDESFVSLCRSVVLYCEGSAVCME